MKLVLTSISSKIGIFLGAVFMMFSCKQQKNVPNKTVLAVPIVKIQQPLDTFKHTIQYQFNSLAKAILPKSNSVHSADSLKIILFLNRSDYRHLLKQDSIIVPDTLISNFDLYSPFPFQVTALQRIRKIVFFSYETQTFVAYENGIRIRWGMVSMGKESTPTPIGLLHTNWKSKKTISSFNEDWVMKWYFNLDNLQGVSMHEFELPGYPASHACIRLNKEDAYWFYYWADSWVLLNSQKVGAYGTPVIIFGKYPFQDKKPWVKLAENRQAILITKLELISQITPYFDLIINRQNTRDSLLQTQ